MKESANLSGPPALQGPAGNTQNEAKATKRPYRDQFLAGLRGISRKPKFEMVRDDENSEHPG